MAAFQPQELLRRLEAHRVRYVVIGGIGATLHGSPLLTRDADICPATDAGNLAFLAEASLLNLTTRLGDLDIAFEPAGTGGYVDLAARAVRFDLSEGLEVAVASLADIIRSKEAADRPKDHAALPTLRLLLERLKGGPDRE